MRKQVQLRTKDDQLTSPPPHDLKPPNFIRSILHCFDDIIFGKLQVSYPQYMHLMSLQEKAMKLDTAMKKISQQSTAENLAKNPKWNTLVELRQSLSKLLPADHANIFNKKSAN